MILALALELSHLIVTLVGQHRSLWSNVFQLLLSSYTLYVCLLERHRSRIDEERRWWLYLAMAFSIWSLAQCIYLHDMYHPALRFLGVDVDGAAWLLVGLPILIAVFPSLQAGDAVSWMDKAQLLLCFAVLYLLVFQQPAGLSLEHAYTMQNVSLALCCFVRLSFQTVGRERRFYLHLGAYLGTYALAGALVDWVRIGGAASGTPVDTLWTLPFTLFLWLTLRDGTRTEAKGKSDWQDVPAVGTLHNLSIGILPLSAIGASIYLAHLRPHLGFLFVGASLLNFLLRVTNREVGWQRAHQSLEDALLRDPLTNLGNRVMLRLKLQALVDDHHSIHDAVLIFLDLDKFKTVNDTLGHELGDKLLVQLASRLLEAAPPGAAVCRLGGDEFVILTRTRELTTAEAIGWKLLESVRQPIHIGRHHLRCTASVGVVQARQDQSVDDLLRTADHAMYKAKQSGRDRVTLFDKLWMDEVSSRWQLETELHQAVEQETLGLAFQPVVDLRRGVVQGFEALARWSTAHHGQVSPGEFIAIAEETGMICKLGTTLLRKACHQIVEWNKLWSERLFISVNVSPRQFADPHLLGIVASVLKETGLEPSLLKLEITETALLVGLTDVQSVLRDLRQLGVQIALDDFGTGYSSLSLLLDLQVDEIKVDRSFVSHLQAGSEKQRIVHKVIQLGQCLGKRIVAEGAETMEDVEYLLAMQCEQVQGWIFGQPETAAWVGKHFAHLGREVRRILEVAERGRERLTVESPELMCGRPQQREARVFCLENDAVADAAS